MTMAKGKKEVVRWSPMPIREFEANVCISDGVCDDKQRRSCEKCGHCLTWYPDMQKARIAGVHFPAPPHWRRGGGMTPEYEAWRKKVDEKMDAYLKRRFKKCRRIRFTFEVV